MTEVLGLAKRFEYFRKISFKKAAAFLAIPVFYIWFPFFAAYNFVPHPFLALFAFYSLNILIVFVLVKRSLMASSKLRYESEDIESKINMQTAQTTELLRQNISLKENINRYSNLKRVIETITQELHPDSVCDSLCSSAFLLVGSGRGACILYTVDNEAQCLRLNTAKKEDKNLIIKAKQGDIFDHWVMMHMNPLLIEDISKDFRFDLDRVRSVDARPVGSLISSPLVSGSTFLGILRLDHPDPGYYNLDDLRFLRSISELGGLALENAQFYSSTQRLAVHDGLTGVFTKGYFMEQLALECRRCAHTRSRFGLLMIDIDHFKKYNDTYGHPAGDIVLTSIAGRISDLVKEGGGVVCRFGGEEFCVILPNADRAEGIRTAQLIREAVSTETFVFRRKVTSVTVSVGVAIYPQTSDDEIGLLMKADKAMYEAKQSGRNKVVAA